MKRFVLAACLLAGCSSPTALAPVFVVQTVQAQYAAGESVALRLSSLAESPLLYRGCSGQLPVVEAGGGRVPSAQPVTACALALSVLNPGTTQLAYVALGDNLLSGTYRVVMQTVFGADGHSLLPADERISNPFRVP